MTSFKEIVHYADAQMKDELTDNEKKMIFEKSKRYILIRNLLDKVEQRLNPEESILHFLPLTNTENSGSLSTGWMGMTYAEKKETKAYTKHFKDTRGNRLLIFTDKRMIFLMPAEFLEDDSFSSFPYTSISSIQLKREQLRYWGGKDTWYLLDFQSENKIFTETLSEEDQKKLLKIIEEIPELQDTPIVNHTVRNNLFDRIFNNSTLAVKVLFLFNLFWVGLFIFVIWKIFTLFH